MGSYNSDIIKIGLWLVNVKWDYKYDLIITKASTIVMTISISIISHMRFYNSRPWVTAGYLLWDYIL